MRAIPIVAVLVATRGAAQADIHLALGLKWLPVSYTQPVSTTGAMGGIPAATPLKGWNFTSIDSYGGAFILDGRLGFLLGLDLGYASQSIQMGAAPSTDLSFTQFGFS